MKNLNLIRDEKKIPDDSLRVSLHAALEAKAKAAAAVESRRQAIERARDLVAAAEAALEATRIGVAEARERHADQIAEAAAGGSAPATPGAVRLARAAEQSALDDLDAARGALERLASGFPELEELHAIAANAVIAAANAVIAPARRARSPQFGGAGQVFRRRRVADGAARGLDEDKDEDVAELSLVQSLTAQERRAKPLRNVKAEASDLLLAGPPLLDAERPAAFAAQEAWRRWRRDLRTNPDAVPPEFA